MIKRIIFFIAALSMVLAGPVPFAAAGEGTPSIVWQARNLGKPSSGIQSGPNGLFYLPAANNLAALDDTGGRILNATGLAATGPLVIDSSGSFFMVGRNMVQEIKLNGSTGWSFTIFHPDNNSADKLVSGPDGLLYLPLPSALYAITREGYLKWIMLEWESGEPGRTVCDTERQILACAGSGGAFFAVHGKKNSEFYVVAVSGEGRVIWSQPLGRLKSAGLATGTDGRLYVTANPERLDRVTRGKVYCFDSDTGSQIWCYQVNFDDLSAPVPSGQGMLYFAAEKKLFALNQKDGAEVWRNQFNKAIFRPAVDNATGRIYIGNADNELVSVTPQGRSDWYLRLDGKAWQPLVAPDGYLYVATDTGSVYRIKD